MACDTAGDTDLYSINKNHKRSVPPKSENRGKILRLTASEGEVPRDVTSHGPADLERGEVLRVEKDESRELDKELGIIGVKIGEEECNDGSVVPKMISTKNLKILSLNSAGISAAAKKGLANYLYRMDPDIICLQETKLREAPNARDAGGNPNEVPICWRTYPYQ